MNFTLTRHALARAVDMCLTPEVIRAVVTAPDIRRWESHSGNNPGWLHTLGRGAECVAAIIDDLPDGSVSVRTFLPGSREAWLHDSQFDPAEGRDASRYLGKGA